MGKEGVGWDRMKFERMETKVSEREGAMRE
jgi:hypothetical protein